MDARPNDLPVWLGPIRREYEGNPRGGDARRRLRLLGVSLLGLSGLGIAWTMTSPFRFYSAPAIALAAIMVILAIALIRAGSARRVLRVVVGAGGFALDLGGRVEAHRWGEIAAIRSEWMPGVLPRSQHLRFKDGRHLVLGAEVRDVDDLAASIESEVAAHRGPEVRHALDSGEAVDFRSVRLSREGIAYKVGFLRSPPRRWADVREAEVVPAEAYQPAFFTVRGEAAEPLISVEARAIENLRILLDEINRRAGGG